MSKARATLTQDRLLQQLYINGRWTETKRYAGVYSPWDARELGRYAIAEPTHVARAIEAAVAALSTCPPAYRRAAVLRQTADLVENRAEEFARCVCDEAGKPISAARTEVSRTIDTLRLSASAAQTTSASTVPMDATSAGTGLVAFEQLEPRGVVAAITPFNFPLNLVAHKIGPAVAAGCPVILKPSEKTPLSAGMLVAAFDEIGLEPGMLNLVTGEPTEVVRILIDDPRVPVITFTGSATVGWDIARQAVKKHTILELGSNTAMVVSASADIDRVVASAVAGAFGYSGQACISLQRIYVHESVSTELITKLVAAAQLLKGGDPADDQTTLGPLISETNAAKLAGWIRQAVDAGANVCAGGKVNGNVLDATVLANVPAGQPVLCEEVFAPLVCVNTYQDLDAAIDAANDSAFGINTAIFTSDISEALHYARRAQSGAVLVNVSPSFRADNMPYGGIKDSGHGREGVEYAVRELLQSKLVVLAS